MTAFRPNVPVLTASPRVKVDAGLAVGAHTFQLVAIDDAGNRSKPARLVVEIQRAAEPVPPRPAPVR